MVAAEWSENLASVLEGEAAIRIAVDILDETHRRISIEGAAL